MGMGGFAEYVGIEDRETFGELCALGDRAMWECPKFCVRDFCECGIAFADIETEASTATVSHTLLGRAERSSPKAAQRARQRGLDGDGADQAIMDVAVMSGALIVRLPESARRTEWQTGPWQPSIGPLGASASRHS